MRTLAKAVTFAAALSLPALPSAETTTLDIGGDRFIAGAQVDTSVDTAGDAFVASRTLNARGKAAGDIHVTGFDVSVTADAGEDLYAIGATVVISGSVAEDLTAGAFTLRTQESSVTSGNARLMGNSVTVEGPVSGALIVTGRDVNLNAEIGGDVRVVAQTLSFGPDAEIAGTLTYSTPEKQTVPERVIAEERVVFEKLTSSSVQKGWDEVSKEMPVLPTFASAVFGFFVSLFFFLVLGALMLTFMPNRLARMRRSVGDAPGQTLVLGVIGLSVLFGMVPVSALTIVGIPFVIILLLAIVVAWVLGYALGAYSVAMRVWAGLGGDADPSTLARLGVFAAALVCVALLNFIPFVGWVVNYTLVLLGVGAMTRAVFQSALTTPDVTLDVDMKPIED